LRFAPSGLQKTQNFYAARNRDTIVVRPDAYSVSHFIDWRGFVRSFDVTHRSVQTLRNCKSQ
jgi:hypothetical protein